MDELSDTRKRILELLITKEMTWRELKKETKLSDPVLARHLKELEKRGLITVEVDKRDKRVKHYSVSFNSEYISKTIGVDSLAAAQILLLIPDIMSLDEETLDKLASKVGSIIVYAAFAGGDAIDVAKKFLEMFGAVVQKCGDEEFRKEVKEEWVRFWSEWKEDIVKNIKELGEATSLKREASIKTEFTGEEFTREFVLFPLVDCIIAVLEQCTPVPLELLMREEVDKKAQKFMPIEGSR